MKRTVSSLRAKIKRKTIELGIIPVWDDRGHHYKFPDSEEYESVTSKLQIVKDPGLMNWKMNKACDFILQNLFNQDFTNPEALIAAAKQVPTQEFEGAGDIGKAVHAWREIWFENWIRTGNSEIDPGLMSTKLDQLIENVPWEPFKAATQGIINAVKDLKAVPLACELSLADRELKVGGMLDDIWWVNGETWLIDLKTSNIGNKNSYYMQVAAYWYMFRKLYRLKVDKLFILHVSKTKFGEYELIELKHPKRYWEMAKSAFKLSDDLAELEELKKPEIIKI